MQPWGGGATDCPVVQIQSLYFAYLLLSMLPTGEGLLYLDTYLVVPVLSTTLNNGSGL